MLGLIFHQLSMAHSSEINGLRSTKCCSETLQNLLYFMHKKTKVVFSFLISCNFIVSLMNAFVYVNTDQAIHKAKNVKLHKTKNEKSKKLHGFLMHKI